MGIAVPAWDFDEEGSLESPVSLSVVRSGHGIGDSLRYLRPMPGGGFLAAGKGGKVWLEASLPKRAGQWESLEVGQALEVGRELWEQGKTYATYHRGQRFEEAKVVRLDAVREFRDVGYQGAHLDGLARVHRDRRHVVRRYKDNRARGAETLKAGPKSWQGYLYDKHAESAGVAPPGVLRFEVRGRSELLLSVWARRQGAMIGQVGDVDAAKVDALARGTLARLGFDREVGAMNMVVEAIQNTGLLSPREQLACLGYATALAYGLPIEELASRHTLAKYAQVLEELGVTPGEMIEQQGELYTARLDYDEGCQVIERCA